jgi:hypothetical protein
MISNLVSSILNPSATAVAADKAAAHQLDDDKNRPVPSTGFSAKPVTARLDRVSVHQSGAGERVDYFHAAKKMLREALSDFAGGIKESFGDIGLDDEMAVTFTKAMMRQTKNALLWGVGFSVKLMTATVSQTSDADNDGTRPSFSIMAKSIEITVNHSDGIIDVATGNVSIESQFAGGPGAQQQSHLLDISDSGNQSTGGLTSALQALQDPQSLFADLDDEAGGGDDFRLDTIPPSDRRDELEATLPRIDTPRVLSRPDYNSRILLSEMNHFRNDRNELITYLRLDALIPLAGKPVAAAKGTAPAPPPPARLAFV